MIGFLIRKNFYDFWDNLFRMMIANFGFVLSFGLTILLPASIPSFFTQVAIDKGLHYLLFALMGAGFLWCSIYFSALSHSLANISDYKSFGFKDFFYSIKETWKSGLVLGLILLAAMFFLVIGIPFYLGMHSFLGVLIAAILFWSGLLLFLALQYWTAVRARLDKRPSKILKKCFIIFMDNPGLTIFLAITNLITLFASTAVGFLLPGPAASLLFLDEALRLRLYKYDWLDKNPDANRRKIPWEELIAEDREKTGSRSLRSFIFPWKD